MKSEENKQNWFPGDRGRSRGRERSAGRETVGR